MADTDVLRPYKVGDPPSLPDGDRRYLANELMRLSQAIGLITEVMKKLEARMVSHGI
jgi:hypothetical protein